MSYASTECIDRMRWTRLTSPRLSYEYPTTTFISLTDLCVVCHLGVCGLPLYGSLPHMIAYHATTALISQLLNAKGFIYPRPEHHRQQRGVADWEVCMAYLMAYRMVLKSLYLVPRDCKTCRALSIHCHHVFKMRPIISSTSKGS